MVEQERTCTIQKFELSKCLLYFDACPRSNIDRSVPDARRSTLAKASESRSRAFFLSMSPSPASMC